MGTRMQRTPLSDGPVRDTARVEQNAVFERIPATLEQGDDVMQTPAGLTGDGLLSFRAEPVLMPPQVSQFLFPFFAASRLSAQSVFEIGLPGGIEGIGAPLDLDVPDDFRVVRRNERHIAVTLGFLAREGPLSAVCGRNVLVLDPDCGFLRMSSFRPLPQSFPYRMVHEAKGLFRDGVPVVVRPAPDHRVQEMD